MPAPTQGLSFSLSFHLPDPEEFRWMKGSQVDQCAQFQICVELGSVPLRVFGSKRRADRIRGCPTCRIMLLATAPAARVGAQASGMEDIVAHPNIKITVYIRRVCFAHVARNLGAPLLLAQ